ncbi:MAG TPA: hypothetical protein ENN67_04845, partial [Firmicutes bacterium]|nr:hypothetical protein [Bacillota bacterium]
MNKAISLSFSKLPLVFIILLFSAGYVISCGHSGSPVMSPSEPFEFKEPAEWSGMRVLWSWNVITIDAERENATIVPIRTAESHWNTLKWLEQGPCTNCVQVTGINPGDPGTILVDVSIRHPFPNQNLTGFDVRGIAMFNASHLYPVSGLIAPDRTLGDGEVVNADGYTSLYNSLTEGSGPQGLEGYIKGKMATVQAPDSQLNGYIQYISSGGTARNAFFAEDEILKTFNIDMPDGVFRFGYAVDACWAPPITKPVTDPIADFGPEANCPEAYNLEISKEPIVTGLTPYGGQLKIVIRDYDWQGPDTVYPPVIECPELFDGFVMANWELNYSNGSRYFALITNSKGAPVGNYRCLVAKRAAEYNPSKPWLDLTAYKLIPVEVKDSMVDVTPPYLNFGPMDVDTDGNYLYVASGKNGLTIFDISDPVNPVWQNNICFNTENLYKIVYSNGYAYAVDTHYNGGLRIYDVDPVESASQVKQVKFGIWTRDCKVMGEYAYLTSDDKLIVVDIDPPQNASVIAEFEFGENVFRLDVAPGYAYVATGNDSVIIVDIDPPESAYIVNEVDIPGYANDIHVVDGYAYIAGWSGGLIIVDVDPPESAYVVGTVPPSGSAISVFYANGYAFVGEGFNGIRVVDVDPPDSAFGVKVVEFPGYTEGICIAGEYAYAAANDAGLRVIDINPPVDSTEVNLAPSPRQVKDIVSSEGYLYVSNFNGGFLIIDS